MKYSYLEKQIRTMQGYRIEIKRHMALNTKAIVKNYL